MSNAFVRKTHLGRSPPDYVPSFLGQGPAKRSAGTVSKKIIIVDAEPVVRKTVATILETAGYEVVQAEDPLAVVDIIESDPPALIITNVSLPGISGHDAMRLYKRHAPKIPVLMVSGLPDADVIEQWRAEPGFAVFPKPFTAGDLSAKVREMMQPTRSQFSNAY